VSSSTVASVVGHAGEVFRRLARDCITEDDVGIMTRGRNSAAGATAPLFREHRSAGRKDE
jgi:hypothetical protein